MKHMNNIPRRSFCVLAAGGMLPLVPAQAQAPSPNFVAVCDVDLWRLLPPFPAPNSAAHLADLAQVYALQKQRTPEQEADANRHANLPVAQWAGDVLGQPLTVDRHPLALALLERTLQDLRAVNRAANAVFAFRKRPLAAALEPAAAALVEQFGPLKPSLDMSNAPPTRSYPSANGTAAFVQGALLGELFPQLKEAFTAKAEHAANLRVLGSAHFHTDLTGSRAVVAAYLAALGRNADYANQLKQAQAQSRVA
jgi:acid phosphatase (class A)